MDGCDVVQSQPPPLSLQQEEALWTAGPWLLISGGATARWVLPVLLLLGTAAPGTSCFVVEIDAFEVHSTVAGKTPGGLQGGWRGAQP